MRLYEFEGKELLGNYGISVPKVIALCSSDNPVKIDALQTEGGMVKAQILGGKRGKAGGVVVCDSFDTIHNTVERLLKSQINSEDVKCVLIEEKIVTKSEHYLSITYDTNAREPVVIFSKMGGIDIEELADEYPELVIKQHINPLLGLQDWQARNIAVKAGFREKEILKIADIIIRAWRCFVKEDARLIEINPLAQMADGNFIALDARLELDDDAAFRHKDRNNYSPRAVGVGREPTVRELEVKAINAIDYRGTVKYLELDGDIAFMAAGGGGSITCMDALVAAGGYPSNYTEYSGNPSKEKVYALTKAILSKPGLNGMWIVGAVANFTRVDTTMEGVIEALAEIKPDFPIVVRRSGPFEKEGLQLLRNAAERFGLDMEIYGREIPMTSTAQILMDKVRIYKNKKKIFRDSVIETDNYL